MLERTTPSTANERLAVHTRCRKRANEIPYCPKRMAANAVMTRRNQGTWPAHGSCKMVISRCTIAEYKKDQISMHFHKDSDHPHIVHKGT